MTARGTMETVMAATRGGAFDYIAKPFDLDRMLETVKRAEASQPAEEEEADAEDLPETRNDRQLGGDGRDLQDGIARRAHRRHRADRRRNRHRQGTGGAHDSPPQHARHAAVRRRGLRVDCADAARERTVRSDERRIHRRRPRPHRCVRSRQSRDRVAGRNRRYRSRVSAQAAALPAGARDSADGRVARESRWMCA